MTFEIEYFAIDGQHIRLKAGGEIELTTLDGERLTLSYVQARILKQMIIAQHTLEKDGRP